MNLNSIASDKPSAPQASQTPNGSGESFQLAYARVFDGRQAPDAAPALLDQQDPVRAATSAHTVHAGDTLSTIARARLTAMGVAAGPAAVRQGVAQLARANHIGNPDRIYAGQKLDMASLDAATAPAPAATALRETDSSLYGGGRMASPHEIASYASWQQEDMVPADDVQVAGAALAQLPQATPAYPAAGAVAEIDRAGSAPMAARQVALYEQNTAGATEKPAEPARPVPDIFYKGITGKMLDAVPMEPSTRTDLQRANSIVSSTFAARSIGMLTGLGGPLGAVAGLLWGIFSSRQIDAAPAGDVKPVADTSPVVDTKQTARTRVAEALN